MAKKVKPIKIFGFEFKIESCFPCCFARKQSSIDIEEQPFEEEEDPTNALLKKTVIFFSFFMLWLLIAIVLTTIVVVTHQVTQMIRARDKVYVPVRVVNNGIWPGYRHEFFDDRVPFLIAERTCQSRDKSSLLHFNSQDQEDKFDLYVSLNFWNEDDHPDYKLWTSGFVVTRQLRTSTIVLWPEPNDKNELKKVRECGRRGEGIINAFGTSEQYWQERHIVKDYVADNQPDSTMIGAKEGCWQHVKRSDLLPHSFYRFVCIKKI